MEVAPVTFRTFRTVFLQNEALFTAIPRMVRDFTSRRPLHSTTAMVFMIMTMAFILAFPTLGSAMTGYSANVEAFVTAKNNQLVRFQEFLYAYYIIHDGSRIGKSDGYIVTDRSLYGRSHDVVLVILNYLTTRD